MAQCTAQSKRSGEQCRRRAMRGRSVCLMHGGRSRAGIAHPNFRTGKYSRDILASNLEADYRRSLEDPRLMELRDDIAILEARERELLRRLAEDSDSAESSTRWNQTRLMFRQFKQARARDDDRTAAWALGELERLIIDGDGEARLTDDLQRLIGNKAKLIEAEHKRQMDGEGYYTPERVMGMMTLVASAARETIRDSQTLATFAERLRRVTVGALGDGETVEAGGVVDAKGEMEH